MAVDDYSPLYTSDTLTPLSVQFSNKDGTAINLSGATFALVMENIVGATVTRKTGTGTWTIDNATAGQAHYAWSSADVAVTGDWSLQVAITIGGATEHCDIKTISIVPTL